MSQPETNTFYIPHAVGQSIFILFATVFVGLKCAVRRYYCKAWSSEDWTIILSWLLFLASIGVQFAAVNFGSGTHQNLLSSDSIHSILKINNVYTILYNITAFWIRVAILVTYMELFLSGRDSKGRLLIIVIIASNFVFYTCSMFLKIFTCNPRRKIWEPETPGTCIIKAGPILTMTGVWNTFSDFLVLLLPALFVSRLRLERRKKLQVIMLLGAGSIAYPMFSIAGIIIRVLWAFNPDVTYWQPRVLIFSQAELASGIMCACLPSLHLAVRRLRSRKLSYTDIDRLQQQRLEGRLAGSKFGFGSRTVVPGAGPDTQHLETVLEHIDHEPEPSKDRKGFKVHPWHLQRKLSARDSSHSTEVLEGWLPLTESGRRRASDNAADICAAPDGGGIRKTTEVSVKFDVVKGS